MAGQSRNIFPTAFRGGRIMIEKKNKQKSVICRVRTCAGYPMGFQVPRLNHSAKMTAFTFHATLLLINCFVATQIKVHFDYLFSSNDDEVNRWLVSDNDLKV